MSTLFPLGDVSPNHGAASGDGTTSSSSFPSLPSSTLGKEAGSKPRFYAYIGNIDIFIQMHPHQPPRLPVSGVIELIRSTISSFPHLLCQGLNPYADPYIPPGNVALNHTKVSEDEGTV